MISIRAAKHRYMGGSFPKTFAQEWADESLIRNSKYLEIPVFEGPT